MVGANKWLPEGRGRGWGKYHRDRWEEGKCPQVGRPLLVEQGVLGWALALQVYRYR